MTSKRYQSSLKHYKRPFFYQTGEVIKISEDNGLNSPLKTAHADSISHY